MKKNCAEHPPPPAPNIKNWDVTEATLQMDQICAPSSCHSLKDIIIVNFGLENPWAAPRLTEQWGLQCAMVGRRQRGRYHRTSTLSVAQCWLLCYVAVVWCGVVWRAVACFVVGWALLRCSFQRYILKLVTGVGRSQFVRGSWVSVTFQHLNRAKFATRSLKICNGKKNAENSKIHKFARRILQELSGAVCSSAREGLKKFTSASLGESVVQTATKTFLVCPVACT